MLPIVGGQIGNVSSMAPGPNVFARGLAVKTTGVGMTAESLSALVGGQLRLATDAVPNQGHVRVALP